MPRNQQPATPPAAEQPSPSSALTVPADIMRDLLQAQRGMIGERQRLPQVKIMGAGAGLYEFADTNDTVRTFRGVILGSHMRNVLWDKAYGDEAPRPRGGDDEEQKGRPACVSGDGVTGVPREGFAHAALQPRDASPTATPVVARGTERISCRTCPYNQWGSKRLIPELMRPGDSGKGKAVTNQRAVYILVEGREAPVMLILPPTSITAFDEYLTTLLNRGIPVQATFTTFTQEIKERGRLKWAQATFAQGDALNQESFSRVLAKRNEYRSHLDGRQEELVEAEVTDEVDHAATNAAPAAGANAPQPAGEEDDDIPF